MPGLNTGDILQIQYRGTLFGQRVINSLHYRVYASSTTESYVQACIDVGFAMYNGVITPGLALADAQAPEYNLDAIRVQKVNGIRGRYVDYQVNQPGVHAGECTTANVAAVITKRTDTASRRGLGSIHIPGIPSVGYSGAKLTAAYKLKIDAVSARLINPFTVPAETTACQPILWAKLTDPVYRVLTGTFVQTTLRVMRRRTFGVGE